MIVWTKSIFCSVSFHISASLGSCSVQVSHRLGRKSRAFPALFFMSSWVTVVSTLCGATLGFTYLLYSDMDLSIGKVFQFGAFFLASAIFYCMPSPYRTRLHAALWALCVCVIPTVTKLIFSLANDTPVDTGIVMANFSGTFLAIGICSNYHDGIKEWIESRTPTYDALPGAELR